MSGPPRSALPPTLRGALIGLGIGLALGVVWTVGSCAGDAEFHLYLLSMPAAGGLVGALGGALFRAVYRLPGAVALTSGTLVAFVGLAQLLTTGPAHLPAIFGASIAMAALVGVPLGVLVHDMALQFAPHLEPLERRTASFGWRVVAVLQRVPLLGLSLRRGRRERLLRRRFPEAWLAALNTHVPIYRRLPPADQQELRNQVMVFLAEKHIEGRGVRVSDAVRVTIAAYACLLTLRLLDVDRVDPYARLRTILVYPETFVPRRPGFTERGLQGERPGPTLGESWQAGVVVLSWKSVREGAADPEDGRNVALHEFAHQLDQENGSAEGVPILEPYMDLGEWARVLQGNYERLQAQEERGEETVLDYYGTTNTAEFFAVATEAFFEQPRQLAAERPDLYDQLRLFYRQDPAEYLPPEAGSPP